MNRKQQSVVLAGMLAFALAGCGSMRGSSTDETGSSGTSSMGTDSSGMSSGASGSSGAGSTSSMGSGAAAGTETGAGSMAGTAGGSTASPQSQGTPAGAPATGTMTPNAVVVTIEAVPKQGTGAVGGSGAGTTGSSMGEDKMYRVTLRMDDGTMLVVTQATPPTFRMGDRVNMTEGAIRH